MAKQKVLQIRTPEQRKAAQDWLKGIGPRSTDANLTVGRHLGIPFNAYLGDPAFRHSKLETYLETVGREILLVPPAKARERMNTGIKVSWAMRIGTWTHELTLTPELFERRYTTPARYAKGQRAVLEAQGITVISNKDWDRVHRMRDVLYADSIIGTWLEMRTASEVTYRWDRDVNGETLACLCRPDWEIDGIDSLFDLKSGRDVSEHGFRKVARALGYDRKAAFYVEGSAALDLPFGRMIFVAIEHEPPHLTAVYEFGEAEIEEARQTVESVMSIHARCLSTGEWAGYPSGVTVLRNERGR